MPTKGIIPIAGGKISIKPGPGDGLCRRQDPAKTQKGGGDTMKEKPFESYEKVTGQKWPGGRSIVIIRLLKMFGIKDEPGSAKANLKLQKRLVGR